MSFDLGKYLSIFKKKNQGGPNSPDFGWKDLLAFTIAAFQVLVPAALLILLSYWLVLFILSRFWLGA